MTVGSSFRLGCLETLNNKWSGKMRVSEPVFIALEELRWIKADGSEVRLIAKVGMPYKTDDGQYRCPVALEGLDARYPDIAGGSSMQALCLATSLLATRLKYLLEDGERLSYVEDPEGSAWDIATLDAVFGR